MPLPSFTRGGRRCLVSLPSDGDPIEVWAGEEGHVFVRVGAEVLGSPALPAHTIDQARRVLVGDPSAMSQANMQRFAALLLAVSSSADEGETP